MSQISEIVARLRANPIYSLSLGSRELFHSNFLGWMLDNYPQMISTVFDGDVAGEVDIKREWRNLDLVITNAAAKIRDVVAIEIKVKDAPKLKQLTEYDGKLEEAFKGIKIQKILLSLVGAPDSVKGQTAWRHLDFPTLGGKIFAQISDSNLNSDHKVIIQFYAQLCCDLGALVAKAVEADRQARSYFFMRPGKDVYCGEIDSALKELRFEDTLNKHRASKLHEEIKHHLKNSDFTGLCLEGDYGLDNKTPHVGASVVLKNTGSNIPKISLGVHIQGKQYRRVISVDGYSVASRNQGKDGDKMKEFIAATDGWRWLFGDCHSNGKFMRSSAQEGYFNYLTEIPTKQQKNKLLCSYAPRYIYQYTTIGDDEVVPINQVVSAVIADLHYAAQLLQDPNYLEKFAKWSSTY